MKDKNRNKKNKQEENSDNNLNNFKFFILKMFLVFLTLEHVKTSTFFLVNLTPTSFA